MGTYQIVKAETEKNGLIAHTLDMGGGKLETVRYTAVRAGLAWPSLEASAFYVIMGEEYVGKTKYEGQQRQRGKLKIFKEQEISSPFLDNLCLQLTDDCTLFNCKHVYTDLSHDHEADAQFFYDFVYAKKIPHIGLEEAPFVDSFALGISLIKRFMTDGFLDIPKDSIAREQLKRVTKSHIGNPESEKRFHATTALRFCVAAYHKYVPTPLGPYVPKRKKRPKLNTW